MGFLQPANGKSRTQRSNIVFPRQPSWLSVSTYIISSFIPNALCTVQIGNQSHDQVETIADKHAAAFPIWSSEIKLEGSQLIIQLLEIVDRSAG